MTVLMSPRIDPDVAALPPPTEGQTRAIEALQARARVATIVHLVAPPGSGRSTVLGHFAARNGVRLLGARHAMEALNEAPPAHLEEALIELIRRAADAADIVVFDDWWETGSFALLAPDRPFLFFQAATALFGELAAAGKAFVTCVGHNAAPSDGAMAATVAQSPLGHKDRAQILSYHFGRPVPDDAMHALDREYHGLNAHQLTALGMQLRDRVECNIGIDDFVAMLDRATPAANVQTAEVEDVSGRRMIGSETAIEMLERTILIPATEPELASALGLLPARGVLLYGPPGTGKTTLGRLLAHRMAGRFFVIDGTMFADRGQFTAQVNRLLNRAAARGPAVVFIDDADVIFRNGQARGFVRQLLSKLDGIASESQWSVCLVMTAMNLADIPPAIVRSGRIDVWIEMQLPDVAQRADIIADYAAAAPVAPGSFDVAAIAARCTDFTPADLRVLIGDATAAAAYDIVCKAPPRPFDEHLGEAADEIAARKRLTGV